jgi:predicted DNA-binding protein
MLVITESEAAVVRKLTVRVDDDTREDLRELAVRRRTTIAGLVRHALDRTFEDELDLIAAERALEEAARDPSSTMSLEEYKAQRSARSVESGAASERLGNRQKRIGTC